MYDDFINQHIERFQNLRTFELGNLSSVTLAETAISEPMNLYASEVMETDTYPNGSTRT